MFISRADVLLERARARTSPSCYAGLIELAEALGRPRRRGPVVDRVWPRLEKIAIDYTVAEPAAAAGRLAVIPGALRLGRRGRLRVAREAELRRPQGEPRDPRRERRVLADASSGIVVSQSSGVIRSIGVTDIVVVDTPDALLVTTSAHAQRVKTVVDALKLSGRGDIL